MHKIALYSLVSATIAAPTHAHAAWTYFASAKSGTASNALASFEVQVPYTSGSESRWYVPANSNTASNPTTSAIRLQAGSEWTFDFSNPAAVVFTGNLSVGNYKIQSQTHFGGSLYIDGRETLSNVKIAFSGVGTYDEATNTFSYSFMNPTINGGGASTFSSSPFPSCQNGQTSILGKSCMGFTASSRNWEGLKLNFVFSESRNSFSGSLQGIDTYGSGQTARTVASNWIVSAGPMPTWEMPVPASAWLFGSALLGLAGVQRRKA